MIRRIFLIAALVFVSTTVFAQSKVLVDVGQAKTRKSLLALPAFIHLGSLDDAKVGQELYAVVNNDLDVSGLFTYIKPDAYLEDPKSTGLKPAPGTPNGFDFNKWKSIGTEFLIRGGYTVVNGQVSLEIYAYYVPDASLVLGKKYQGPVSAVRKIAHSFTDEFVRTVTGKPSFFLNKIVVAIDNGPRTHREIFLMDWDGANPRQITQHRSISISPDWSPNGELVAYTSFITRRVGKGPAKKNPDLFMYEVNTGRRWLVSYREGINSGANFLTNNKELLITLSMGKTADIYRMAADGKSIKQLTAGPGTAMNVEPAISPDGTQIAFSSDRSGKPMIYVMNVDGSNPRRLTFAGHYNSTPTWSPDGKKIAFAGVDKDKGAFDIFVINEDGTGLQRLTSARKTNGKWANNEAPAFAPDGQRVMFVSDRTGTSQLYMINIDGTNERRITFDSKNYSKPKWGPAN